MPGSTGPMAGKPCRAGRGAGRASVPACRRRRFGIAGLQCERRVSPGRQIRPGELACPAEAAATRGFPRRQEKRAA